MKLRRVNLLLVVILVLAVGVTFLVTALTSADHSRRRSLAGSNAPRGDSAAADAATAAGRTGAPVSAPREEALSRAVPPSRAVEPLSESTVEPDLPGLGERELNAAVRAAQADRICREMDAIMQAWPRYSAMRDPLYAELMQQLDLDSVPNEQLVQRALALREEFWRAGGNFSKNSYRDGYTARLLLEIAHRRDPQNMTITDELVETMQAVEVSWSYVAQGEALEKVRNEELAGAIRELRLAQFEQIRKEVEQGRTPGWQDFVRANDLPLLLGKRGEFEAAKEVVQWEIQHATQGRWTAYAEPLARSLRILDEGDVFEFNIYWASNSSYPDEYRYARRLPSFRGPEPQQRGVTAVHKLSLDPVWTSDEGR